MTRRRATLKDVAEAVGVHVSTVSRALNPETRHFIRPEVAETILEAARRLEYKPNAAAYSLRTNRTRIIGVVIPDIANPVFPPIIRGIEDVLSEHGYMAMLVNSEPRNPRHAATVAALQAHGIDGLVMASLERNDRTIRSAVEEGIPVVTVNRRTENPDVASVTNDEDSGIRQILEHLKGLGHSRVVNVAGPQSISTGKARYDAFERHRRDLAFDTSPELVVFADALNEPEGERCAALALDRVSCFTAILAANDQLAIGTVSLLRKRGIVCPAGMSVTGFNDMPMVDRFDPPLTTVRVQQYQVGRRAAEILLDLIRGGEPEAPPLATPHIVMPVELIVRGSTTDPPGRQVTGPALAG